MYEENVFCFLDDEKIRFESLWVIWTNMEHWS